MVCVTYHFVNLKLKSRPGRYVNYLLTIPKPIDISFSICYNNSSKKRKGNFILWSSIEFIVAILKVLPIIARAKMHKTRPISERIALVLNGRYGRFISRNRFVNFILIFKPGAQVNSMLSFLKPLDILFHFCYNIYRKNESEES